MFQGKQAFTCSTKLSKTSPAKITKVVVVWDGASEATVKGLAVQALMVKVQGNWRSKGVIPESAEILVKDHAPGSRHGLSVEEAFAALTPEQRAELVKKYTQQKAA